MTKRLVFDNGAFQVEIDSGTGKVSFRFSREYSFDIDELLELVIFLDEASGLRGPASDWRKKLV